MLFIQYTGRVAVIFYVLVRTSLVQCNKSPKEQALSNVLKNITLANKALQDLLKNYERLDRIYKSEELLQSYSSSHEIDQTFKSFVSNKKKIKHRNRPDKTQTSSTYRGTVMIYAGESDEKESADTNENVNKVNINNKPTKSYLNYVPNGKAIYKQDLNKNIADEGVLNNRFQKEESVTYNDFSKHNDKSKEDFQTESSVEDIQSEEVEQIIIDIPKDISGIEEDKKDISDRSIQHKENVISNLNKPVKNMMGEKTRFSIKHSAHKRTERKSEIESPSMIKNNGTKIKRVVYSESFSPYKLWQQIVNKPVRLRKDSEQLFRKNNMSSKSNQKITFLILTNNNQKDRNDRNKKPKSNTKGLPKLSLINKMSRSEYGETCLHLPIKKCKKALQIVKKNICKRRYKCKTDFKSDFTQNSKDGCNKEFAYTANINNNKNSTTKENIEKFNPPEFRELKKKNIKNKRDREHINILLKNEPIQHVISLRNETPQDTFVRTRKLKDKYEKKCQKESVKKCNNACLYAINQTCTIHVCEKKKKKSIKSECKSQCKQVYIDVKKRIKSSSESDSESYSDSESESNSN